MTRYYSGRETYTEFTLAGKPSKWSKLGSFDHLLGFPFILDTRIQKCRGTCNSWVSSGLVYSFAHIYSGKYFIYLVTSTSQNESMGSTVPSVEDTPNNTVTNSVSQYRHFRDRFGWLTTLYPFLLRYICIIFITRYKSIQYNNV